jgi:hypothetical protein
MLSVGFDSRGLTRIFHGDFYVARVNAVFEANQKARLCKPNSQVDEVTKGEKASATVVTQYANHAHASPCFFHPKDTQKAPRTTRYRNEKLFSLSRSLFLPRGRVKEQVSE